MKLTPTPEQQAIIEKSISEPTRAILNASTPGAGKTLISTETVLRGGWERVLILGIKDTDKQWAKSFSVQSGGSVDLKIINGTKKGRAHLEEMLAGEPGVYFSGLQFIVTQDWEHRDKINPVTGEPIPEVNKKTGELTGKNERERAHKKLYKKMKTSLDALIVDEVHLASRRYGANQATIKSIPSEWKMALSGTFYGNRFEKAWTVTRWLWPELIDPSFHRWKEAWCAMGDPIYVRRGGKVEVIEQIAGEKSPGAFVASLPCYVRIEAEKEVPEPKVVRVDLSPTQRAQYNQMEEDSLVWLRQKHPGLSDAQLAPLVAEVPISQRARLRTIALGECALTEEGEVTFWDDARSSKLDALSGLLAHYGRQKVVIYTHSKRFAKVTVRRMLRAKLSVAEWSGDISSDGRAAIKEAFLAPLDEGGLQYIVAVISAFGTGLDGFQNVCSKIIWLSEAEGDAVLNEQAVKRIWRRGVEEEAFEHVKILANDTLDDGIFQRLIVRDADMKMTMRVAA